MSWLDALLGRIQNGGSSLALGLGLNFTSGLRARANTTTKYIDVDVSPGTLTAELMAPETSNRSVPFVLHSTYSFSAAAADLALITSAPFAFSVLRVEISAESALGAALRVRSATGGGGAAYSSSFTAGAAGVSSNLVSVPLPTVAIGGSVYLRTDGAAVESGDVSLYCIRV